MRYPRDPEWLANLVRIAFFMPPRIYTGFAPDSDLGKVLRILKANGISAEVRTCSQHPGHVMFYSTDTPKSSVEMHWERFMKELESDD